MLKVYYERYVNDYDRQDFVGKADSLETLKDEIFSSMKVDFTGELSYNLHFPLPEHYPYIEEGPGCIHVKPGYNSPDYNIYRIDKDGKVIFSDGRSTGGKTFWNNEVKDWLRECENFRTNPAYDFDVDQEEEQEKVQPVAEQISPYSLKRDNTTISLTPEEVENIYRQKELEYRKNDALTHMMYAADQSDLSDEDYKKLQNDFRSGVYDGDAELLANYFLENYDCNVSENDMWDLVLEEWERPWLENSRTAVEEDRTAAEDKSSVESGRIPPGQRDGESVAETGTTAKPTDLPVTESAPGDPGKELSATKELINNYFVNYNEKYHDEEVASFSDPTKVSLADRSFIDADPPYSVSVYADLKHNRINWYAGYKEVEQEGLVKSEKFDSTGKMNEWMSENLDDENLIGIGQDAFEAYDTMDYDQLYEALCDRLKAENDMYVENLLEKPPRKILQSSWEICASSDILCELQEQTFQLPAEEGLRDMLKAGVSLDDVTDSYSLIDTSSDIQYNCGTAFMELALRSEDNLGDLTHKADKSAQSGIAGYVQEFGKNFKHTENKDVER